MIRTVYADLLFLINFSMDFLCFFLVSRLFSRKLSLGRSLIASAFGGVYAVCSLFFPFRGVLLLAVDLLICVAMCFIAEARRGMKPTAFLREVVVYTGVSMALGGIMTALYSILNEMGIPESLEGEEEGISAWLFLLLAVVGGGATLLGSRFFRENVSRKRFRVAVTVCGETETYRAMIDTGNHLADPISGTPAAILDVNAAKKLFPSVDPALWDHPADCLAALPPGFRSRARFLAVKSVTGEGLLLALRPDVCRITPEESSDSICEERDLLLAVAPLAGDEVELLLPPGILQNT